MLCDIWQAYVQATNSPGLSIAVTLTLTMTLNLTRGPDMHPFAKGHGQKLHLRSWQHAGRQRQHLTRVLCSRSLRVSAATTVSAQFMAAADCGHETGGCAPTNNIAVRQCQAEQRVQPTGN